MPAVPKVSAALVALVATAALLVGCTAQPPAAPSSGDPPSPASSPSPASATEPTLDSADRIAFGRWAPGEDLGEPPVIWTANPDGSDERPAGSQRGWYIEWSPDRSHLIFDFVDPQGNTQIGTVKPDGSDFTQLTTGTAFNADPAYSPDGSTIVFSHSPVGEEAQGFEPHLWVMEADGTNAREVIDAAKSGVDWEPVYSPDGSQIVFTREVESSDEIVSAVHVVNVDGTDIRVLTEFGDYVEHPRWSPDGGTIIYNIETAGPLAGAPENGIWTVPAAGGDSTQLLASTPTLHAFKPSYSPDGSQILFGCAVRGMPRENLCVMNADGSDIDEIISTPEIENHGVWG